MTTTLYYVNRQKIDLAEGHAWKEIFDKSVGVSLGFKCRDCGQEWNAKYQPPIVECEVFRVIDA